MKYKTIGGDGFFDKRKAGVLPPQSRKLLEQIKDEPIRSLKVVRTPISSTLTKLLNIVSFGSFKSTLQQMGYDQALHLTLFINDKYSWQKTEVIRLKKENPIKKESEVKVITQIPFITIGEMVERTRIKMGDDRFSNYNPKNNNCQSFIIGTLSAMNIMTPELQTFIQQDSVSIFSKLPRFVNKFSEIVTDVAARANRLIEGEGTKKQTKWIRALKDWNKDKDKYCIPKKGTKEYDEVIKLMRK